MCLYRRTESERRRSKDTSERKAPDLQQNGAPQDLAQAQKQLVTLCAWSRRYATFSPRCPAVSPDAGGTDRFQPACCLLKAALPLQKGLCQRPATARRARRKNTPSYQKRTSKRRNKKTKTLRMCTRTVGRFFTCKREEAVSMVTLFQEVAVIQRKDKTNLLRRLPLNLKPETTSLSTMGIWVHRGPSWALFPALKERNTYGTWRHRRPAGRISPMDSGKLIAASSPALLTGTSHHLLPMAFPIKEFYCMAHFQDLLQLMKRSSLLPPDPDWDTCSRGVWLRYLTLLAQEMQIREKMEVVLRVHLDLSPSLSVLEAEISPVSQRSQRCDSIKIELGLKQSFVVYFFSVLDCLSLFF